MPPRPATSVLTDEDSRAWLEAQLGADEAHVLDALSHLEIDSPLCCLGLVYVADDELASVSYIYGWTVAAREAAFAADPEAALWDLWSPPHWDCQLDDLVEPPAPLAGTAELTNALLAAGCDEPAGSVLMDLAHRLNRAALPVPATADFACWAGEHEMDDEPWKWMTAVARPEVVARYESRGWFRLPEPD